MDPKRQREIENKKRHKVALASSKTRRSQEPVLDREPPKFKANPVILIVCEGKNTEPSYFRQFRLTSATIKVLGEGYNTIGVVKQAIDLAAKRKYDKVWVVFDKDDHNPSNFNNAITMAKANGFGVAYSNQAFEYWLILHFNDHQGGKLNRSDYERIINGYIQPLGAYYEGDGNKLISTEFFNILDANDPVTGTPRVKLALTRAKKIDKRLDHQSPAIEESSTTVFKLVGNILKYI